MGLIGNNSDEQFTGCDPVSPVQIARRASDAVVTWTRPKCVTRRQTETDRR